MAGAAPGKVPALRKNNYASRRAASRRPPLSWISCIGPASDSTLETFLLTQRKSAAEPAWQGGRDGSCDLPANKLLIQSGPVSMEEKARKEPRKVSPTGNLGEGLGSPWASPLPSGAAPPLPGKAPCPGGGSPIQQSWKSRSPPRPGRAKANQTSRTSAVSEAATALDSPGASPVDLHKSSPMFLSLSKISYPPQKPFSSPPPRESRQKSLCCAKLWKGVFRRHKVLLTLKMSSFPPGERDAA